MKNDIKKLYYSIGEVSEMVGLKSYVLRYWETEFKQLSPPKNRAGNRTYRQKDIDLIFKIKNLLYERKFTIEHALASGHKMITYTLPRNNIETMVYKRPRNKKTREARQSNIRRHIRSRMGHE